MIYVLRRCIDSFSIFSKRCQMMCLFMHTTCSYTVRNKNMKNGCVRVDTKYDHFFNIFTQVIYLLNPLVNLI